MATVAGDCWRYYARDCSRPLLRHSHVTCAAGNFIRRLILGLYAAVALYFVLALVILEADKVLVGLAYLPVTIPVSFA